MFTKNEQVILSHIRKSGPADLGAIWRETDLARSSLHGALNRLVELGVLVSDENLKVRPVRYKLASSETLDAVERRITREFRQAVFALPPSTKRRRIVFPDSYRLQETQLQQLRTRFDVKTYEDSPHFLTPELFALRARDANVVVRWDSPPVDERFLRSNPQLEVIVCPTRLPKNIDLVACEKHNVRVVHLDWRQRYFATTELEYVLNALLTLRASLFKESQSLKFSRVHAHPASLGRNLAGSKIGLIFDWSNVTNLISVLRALDCEVSAATTLERPPPAMELGLPGYTTVDELWSWADMVVILSGTFSVDELLVKPAIPEHLVICGQYASYSPEIIRQQIKTGSLKGVVIDIIPQVFDAIQLDASSQDLLRPIVNLPNVIITPEMSIVSHGSLKENNQMLFELLMDLDFNDSTIID